MNNIIYNQHFLKGIKMANKLTSFFSNIFGRSKGSIVVEKQPFYIYKKRTALDYISLFLGFIVALLVIFNLLKITGVSKSLFSSDHIAVIKINGTISSDSDANGYSVSKGLLNAFENEHSKAVVLRINSGGGSPYHAEMIWNQVRYLKNKYPNKPVYALIEDVGASAAYYIASSADTIIVGNTTIIGSIGVLMVNYDIRELMSKVGVKDRSFHSGENKLAYSMSQDITNEQTTHLNEMLGVVHENFIDAVKKGRGSRLGNSPDLFSGTFWTGSQSLKFGLADKIGDMNLLKRELKIDDVEDYTISKDSLGSMLGMGAESVGDGIASSFKKSLKEESEITFK